MFLKRIDEFIAFINHLMRAWERYEGQQFRSNTTTIKEINKDNKKKKQ